MKHKTKQAFPSEGEAKLFGREILALAARMVAQGRRISLKGDAPFKLFLASENRDSRACLRHFLSAVIGREVRRVKVRNPDLLPDVIGKKQPRLDINCEFDGGRRADIELQLTKADDDQKIRALYYGGKLFSGVLNEGNDYEVIPAVYQIFLIDFDLFGDGEFYHRVMMRLDDGTLFSDRLQLLFLSLKVPGRVSPGLKKAANWCKFIAGVDKPGVLSELGRKRDWKEELAMALRAYNRISEEERAWAYHLSMDRAEADYKNGLRRARRKGREDALKEARKEAREETHKAREQTARNMLAMGLGTPEQIAQATDLPLAEVEKLAAGLSS